MQRYIVELSKYFIMGFMVLYTLTGFGTLFFRVDKKRSWVFWLQNFLMFIVQSFCFIDLYFLSDDITYLLFYAFVEVFLFGLLFLVTTIYENCNRQLLNHLCMLLGIGFVMISRLLGTRRSIRQYVIVLISLILSLLIPLLFNKISLLKQLTWIYAAVGILMLGIVLIMGQMTRGSFISVELFGITFQPSEFVKILFVFFLAGALCEKPTFFRVALTAVLAGIHVFILVLSTDLGSALIFFMAYVLIVFVATKNYLYLLAGGFGGSAAAFMAYRLFTHVRIRVLAWQNPWHYIDKEGFQITQSLFAIGGGSWFGMGLYQGDPTAIPLVSADFIYSSICEELGVVFGICLILVCLCCFITMMQIALHLGDRFEQLIVYGLGVMYIFQIFLTVGGDIKYIPLTGVTLPLVSYGGSSVMTTMLMFFIIQSIMIRNGQEGGNLIGTHKKDRKRQSKETKGSC